MHNSYFTGITVLFLVFLCEPNLKTSDKKHLIHQMIDIKPEWNRKLTLHETISEPIVRMNYLFNQKSKEESLIRIRCMTPDPY